MKNVWKKAAVKASGKESHHFDWGIARPRKYCARLMERTKQPLQLLQREAQRLWVRGTVEVPHHDHGSVGLVGKWRINTLYMVHPSGAISVVYKCKLGWGNNVLRKKLKLASRPLIPGCRCLVLLVVLFLICWISLERKSPVSGSSVLLTEPCCYLATLGRSNKNKISSSDDTK